MARPKGPPTRQVNARLSEGGYDLLEECRSLLETTQGEMIEVALRHIHPQLKHGTVKIDALPTTEAILPPTAVSKKLSAAKVNPKSQAELAKEFRNREAARLGVCPGCGADPEWCEGLKDCPKGE